MPSSAALRSGKPPARSHADLRMSDDATVRPRRGPRSVRSNGGTTARLAAPATSRPMLSRTTAVAPRSAICRLFTAIPSSRISRNGTETR